MRRFLSIFGCIFAGIAMAHAAELPAHAASSADAEHLHVQLIALSPALPINQLINAGLYFKLEPGWHVYWQNAGDSGEPPHITWTLPAGIDAGPMQFPTPQRLPLGPLMDFGYENEVLFPFTLTAGPQAKPGPATLRAHVSWLVCRAVCIPGKADLEITRTVGSATGGALLEPDAGIFQRLGDNLPKPLPTSNHAVFQPTATGFRLQVNTGQPERQAAFFPSDQEVIDNPSLQQLTPTDNGFILDLKKDANLTATPAQLNGVIELSGGRNYQIAATPGAITAAETSTGAETHGLATLARIGGLAFLGGLLLNLMPCVFPVLFLKGLALVQAGGEERRRLRLHGLVYTAGILVSFWLLVAALLGLRATGATLGWGFQFQSPVFLMLMAALLFFLGLSLAGQFDIGLTLTGKGQSLAAKQGHAGSFFTGVLAVVVATPCAAPFMGAAIGYALAQPAAVTFAVFTALALGLAAPYLALTLRPAWTRILPKPGAWMEILKQAVSPFMFGTVIWLAWVVAQAYGANLLLALLSIFLLVAVAGWFLGRWPARRWSAAVASLVLVAAVISSAYAPARLAESPTQNGLQTSSKNGSSGSAQQWQPWSADAVQKSLAAGQPVFVDFTASWCLSCQVNERVALTQPEVQQAFHNHNVVLLKADWTREDPAITQALATLGRSGVPVYALYIPGEQGPRLLPQVLTPGLVTEALATLPESRPTQQGN
jgi:thiol:disulfide interchange protein